MLKPTGPKARECYAHAIAAREKAFKTDDPRARSDYLDMEKRWVRLANSYEYSDRLADYFASNRRNYPNSKAG
jgi:hypothetical protein